MSYPDFSPEGWGEAQERSREVCICPVEEGSQRTLGLIFPYLSPTLLILSPLQGPPGRAGLPGSDGAPGPPGTSLMLPVSCLLGFGMDCWGGQGNCVVSPRTRRSGKLRSL